MGSSCALGTYAKWILLRFLCPWSHLLRGCRLLRLPPLSSDVAIRRLAPGLLIFDASSARDTLVTQIRWCWFARMVSKCDALSEKSHVTWIPNGSVSASSAMMAENGEFMCVSPGSCEVPLHVRFFF